MVAMITMAATSMTTLHDRRHKLNTEDGQIMDCTAQKCQKVPKKTGYPRMIFLLCLPFLLHDTVSAQCNNKQDHIIHSNVPFHQWIAVEVQDCSAVQGRGEDGLMLSNG